MRVAERAHSGQMRRRVCGAAAAHCADRRQRGDRLRRQVRARAAALEACMTNSAGLTAGTDAVLFHLCQQLV